MLTPCRSAFSTAFFLAALLTSAPTIQAQTTKAELLEILSNQTQTDAFVESAVAALEPPDHLIPILTDHFKMVYEKEIVLETIATELHSNVAIFRTIPEDEIPEYAREFGATWVQATAISGIIRLTPPEQRSFFRIAAALFSAMPPSDCADLIRGELTPVEGALVEIAAMRSLPGEEVAIYLSVLRNALFAAIEKRPIVVPLTPAERQLSQTAFREALQTAIEAHPRGRDLALASGLSALTPAQDICDFTTLTIETAIAIEGNVGDLVMKAMAAQR